MTNSPITPFLFEGQNLVRVVMLDGDPWFVAADVCRILHIKNVADAVGKLDDDEKRIASTDTSTGEKDAWIVSESGLYTLILRSRDAMKPGTVPHRLRKWVTGEVLPAIRQTGSYSAHQHTEVQPPAETPPFPHWPLEMMRTRKGVADLYRMAYGPAVCQWAMDLLDFPKPPQHLITEGRQIEMFETITITRGHASGEA